jgi:FixJ family two-component response regulator
VEVLRLVAQRLSNEQVAEQLAISPRTVNVNAMMKEPLFSWRLQIKKFVAECSKRSWTKLSVIACSF